MALIDDELGRRIVAQLTDDLRKPEYQGHPNPLHGHCYVASEAYYWMHGARHLLSPCWIKHEGTTHWFLELGPTKVIDLTAGQFSGSVPYHVGTRCGFLTQVPSKRAQELINRVWKAK